MLECSVNPLFDLFHRNALPQLIYMTKQELGPSCLSRPLHSHDDLCEILLIYKGFGVYRSGVSSYAVKEGDIVFCNPHIQHEMADTPGQVAGVYCFGLSGFKRPGLPENYILPLNESFIRPTGTNFDALFELAEVLFLALGTKNGDANASLPLVLAAFLCLSLSVKPDSQKYSHDLVEYSLAERVQRYIDTNYIKEFTLEDIAAEFRCSASYISHIFKDVIGYSPMQYKTRCRIGLAQTLLISSDMTSTQVATMVGYDNTNYFNTVFSKIVGVSPIRYRKQYLLSMHGKRTQ